MRAKFVVDDVLVGWLGTKVGKVRELWSRRERRRRLFVALLAPLMLALGLPSLVRAVPEDVNPDVSTNANANAATGGRVNHMAATPGNNQIFYVASEYGGLFKSTNGGANWTHLASHVPVMTWDVEVDPSNVQRVYATSWYDGRVNALSGINVSTNGGGTWSHPASGVPPAGTNCANPLDELNGFGISIDPTTNARAAIGTSCGLAVTTDSGANWTFVDPTPATAASDVWDVNIQAGGIIDVCGADGHLRSTNGGANWSTGWTQGGFVPTGRCSIAASPDENYVLFIYASDNNIYESDDAGATWTNLGSAPNNAQGRIPFVVTNQRADDGGGNNIFDIWGGDVQLFSQTCTTPNPAVQGGANRCAPANGWTNRQTGAHWDGGDLLFDSQVAVDACPVLYSSDGGVHTNTNAGNCQNPTWNRSNVGLHALYLWSMDGSDRAGAGEDLYMGAQDTGTFATTTADSNPPTWTNPNCCDTFDIVGAQTWVLGTTCCFRAPARFNQLELATPGYVGNAQVNTYPPGNINTFNFGPRIAQFGPTSVAVLTTGPASVYITTNILAPAVPTGIQWTGLAAPPEAPCGIRTSVDAASNPVFYVQAGQCTARGNDRLYRYTGTTNTGTWTRVDNLGGLNPGQIGLFAVDPNNSNNLYISYLGGATPQMMSTTDGGTTWNADPELDTLMTANGVFKYQTISGAANQSGGAGPRRVGYPQPTLLAYDPEAPGTIVAGGADSGVFISFDSGANWSLVTDPISPATSGKAHLPRPRFAYFDHEPAGTTTVYVGTQGRGAWRLSFRPPTADAGGPYATDEGSDVTVTAAGSSDPDNQTLTYTWDLDNDGEYDDASGVTAQFTNVGQDGSFTIGVKATNSDGAYDTDTATVTVDNVAPAVSGVATTSPDDENTAPFTTVTGVVSDPGWLESLSATIDWGDGSPIETVNGTNGVLENNRPNATLQFSFNHNYGDDGSFTVKLCGVDDDTQTCVQRSISIDNVKPTAELDLSGATDVNGTPTIIAPKGEPVTFKGRSRDPGSDDLLLTWLWGDGSPPEATMYPNDPNSFPDPDPSPTVNPRDVTDTKVHTFGDACLYTTTFMSNDDDGGAASQNVNVVITGNADRGRMQGYWQHQYGRQGNTDFTDAELQCYLEIIGYTSKVFDEFRDASTTPKAHDVLWMSHNGGSNQEHFDRALLTAWLNFANGAVGYNEAVDTDGKGGPDTPFSAAMAAAEAVRTDPMATDKQLDAQRKVLHRISQQV